MKSRLTILLLTATLYVYAPSLRPEIIIVAQDPVTPNFDPLIEAIFYVESHCDTMAYNPKEDAVGGLQIRQCKLDDFNKRTGNQYLLADMYDYAKAREVFYDHARQYHYQDWETIARKWNGSGPQTDIYWIKVQTKINKR
jgi:hypothetical protein